MRNYAKTVIYKIECKDPNITETYGSYTTNLISRRRDHKSECNNPNSIHYNSYHYRFIRENGGWDNWEVVWQYNYPCENANQANLEKKRFIKKHNCELNTNSWFYIKEPEIQVSDLTEEDIINQIKELEERLEKRRAANRAANRVENMTEEQKAKKKEKDKKYRANLPEAQREEIRANHRIENLTSEQREKNNARARVANMTEEQKAKKKEKDKKYRANLPEAQREKINARRRVENMTEEQKAKKKEKNRLYREKQKLLKENKVVVI